GADDVTEAGDLLEVLTAPERFEAVKEALDQAKIAPASAEVTMMPSSTTAISGKQAEQMVRLLEALEDHDDVQHVSSNMDIAAEGLDRRWGGGARRGRAGSRWAEVTVEGQMRGQVEVGGCGRSGSIRDHG